MTPRLIVEQRITAFANKYAIYSVNSEGEKADMIGFAQQKRLAFKEKVSFYSDEAKSKEVFGFRAEKVLDVHGNYLVEDANGKQIGGFRKLFGKSLLVSSWNVLDTNGEPVLLVKESSVPLAILRRFLEIVPFIGEILGLITTLFKYHFDFVDLKTGNIVGKYQKTTLSRDHYMLSVEDKAYSAVDWRTYAALAVALDALQSR
jgi:hypothetical protein